MQMLHAQTVPSPLAGEGQGGGWRGVPHANVGSARRQRAKTLRHKMTRAETLLWRYIKAHRIDGLGFRRHTPIGPYIADFVCHSARLIVELDGESHDLLERQIADRRRDRFLAAKGFCPLRFTNEQVMSNLEGVVETIRLAAQVQPPSLTLPRKGGGNGAPGVASSHDG